MSIESIEEREINYRIQLVLNVKQGGKASWKNWYLFCVLKEHKLVVRGCFKYREAHEVGIQGHELA